jgi:hypothetical protein
MSKGALGMLAAYWPEDTARYAHIPLKTVNDVAIYASAQTAAEQPALVDGDQVTTYGELSERVRRIGDALRARCNRGARVAIALDDPVELLAAAFGAFDAELVTAMNSGSFTPEALRAFAPELVVGSSEGAEGVASVSFADLHSAPGKAHSGRRDFRTPILALEKKDRSGEVLHNHRSLVATSIAAGSFFMLAKDSRVALLEPPTRWHTLALMLGTLQKGGTVWACWKERPVFPDRVDYVVCGWDAAGRFLEADASEHLPARIGAGAILAIEGHFSVSRRRRLSRQMKVSVLTLLGSNDLGPIIASHPSWFLDDAAGIPLPNVDTRPMNPSDRTPVNIGWESVEEAEIGIRSALAPAGGAIVEGWLQSGVIAEVDPTGLYFLHGAKPLRAV